MSNILNLERKKPHFISTEFKAQRLINHSDKQSVSLSRNTILKALSFIAIAATTYFLLHKKQTRTKKNNEALSYEIW